ncbi:TIGR04326 family surface carbohydrate biosynthesis protein [Leptospira levettii]|uniref:TIGR04326 family surface carbohydrate biosynthesis protein n=1 Tax=Leptospira levettii TaxID=2023178 RepID=UPI00142D79F6|nr:TIGR04326 family surface carbohydrate biosynthesis protein [Leptospira levettii]
MNLLIWFERTPPPEFDGQVVLWNSFSQTNDKDVFSIPSELEKEPKKYRSLYVNFIHSVGKKRILGKTLEELLYITDTFSLWWMSLPYEKNYGKSTELTNAVKTFVLEDFLKNKSYTLIKYSPSAPSTIVRLLKVYASENGKRIGRLDIKIGLSSVSLFRTIYSYLPEFLKAFAALVRFVLLYIGINRQQKTEDKQPSFHVFDYLFHLKKDQNAPDRFESNYWSELLQIFRDSGKKVQYDHIFIPHKAIPDANSAVKIVDTFNYVHSKTESHVLIENISIILLLNVTFSYFRIYLQGLIYKFDLIKVRSELGLLPVLLPLREEFQSSLFGSICIQNLFFYYFIKKQVEITSSSDACIFLLENQGWEKALVYHWKKHQLGKIIGVAHSTVRFWDLRYVLPDSEDSAIDAFMPDYIAVNGHIAEKMLLQSGYKDRERQLRVVEALRFLGLQRISQKTAKNAKSKLLVLTDYLLSVTQFQMKILEEVAHKFEFEIIVKAHPACPVETKDFPGMIYSVSHQDVTLLLETTDVVYASNITSAGIEAYYLGIPVVSSLDPESLNLSPLFGYEDVVFVSSSEGLISALGDLELLKIKTRRSDIFSFHSDFKEWRRLLNLE